MQSLEEFLPKEDEKSLLSSYTGDIECLGKAERYMVIMMDFPSAAKRIQCMLYKQQFKSRISELKLMISKIEGAADDCKLSNKFKKVLKTILKVGNTMNDSGEQKGFSIEALSKLSSAKAFDNKTSILQYVVKLIFKNDPSCLLYTDELTHVGDASKYTMEMIEAERTGLKKGLDTCAKVISEIIKSESGGTVGALPVGVSAPTPENPHGIIHPTPVSTGANMAKFINEVLACVC